MFLMLLICWCWAVVVIVSSCLFAICVVFANVCVFLTDAWQDVSIHGTNIRSYVN